MELKSTNPDAKFAVMVEGTNAYDGYMAIPVSQWGRTHVLATFCEGPGSVCQTVILAHENHTNVVVTIPAENDTFVADRPDVEYAPGVRETRVLMQYDAWVIQRPYELTGSVLVANASVGVLVGAAWTTCRGSTGGVVMEQLPRLTTVGREYVSLGVGTVRYVTTESRTTVHCAGSGPVLLERPGQWIQRLASSGPVTIRADRPVVVVEFGGLRRSPIHRVFPFFVVVPPVAQYLDSGNSTVFPSRLEDGQSLVLITRETSEAWLAYRNTSLRDVAGFSSVPVERSSYRVVTAEDGNLGEAGVLEVGQPPKGPYAPVVVAPFFKVTSGEGVSLTTAARWFGEVNPAKASAGTRVPQTPAKLGRLHERHYVRLVEKLATWLPAPNLALLASVEHMFV